MEIRNRNNAQHYLWGQNCEGWHLVSTDDLSVIEERMLPNTTEVKHYHQRSNQCFYVLSGQITIEAEGARLVLSAGDSIYVPSKIAHKVVNPEFARCTIHRDLFAEKPW